MKNNSLKRFFACFISAAMIFSSITMSSALDTIEMIGTNSRSSSNTSSWWQSLESAYLGNETTEEADMSVIIDPSMKYQEYAGIGISLDETSVSNLWKLGDNGDGTYDMDKIKGAIKMLVDKETGAGFELFRITIGSPDCIEHIPFWSYDDMPLMEEGCLVDPETGECPCGEQHEDWDLEHFTIQKDIDYHIIDTAKLILEYNPDAKFFASAWSAPAWMTTTGTFVGWVGTKPDGTTYNESALRDDCINVFARYYAEFIKAYAEQGIDIYAITELNEPGMDVPYPSMHLSVEQQQLLAIEIGEVFEQEGLEDVELWMHDFNFYDWKDPDSTETKNHYRVYEGALGEATKAVADGVAFHPYWGDASVMKDTFEETGESVYLTEAGGMDPGTILDYFTLNCSSYTGWTMITDQNGGTLHWNDNKSLHVREDDIDRWTEIGQMSGAKWRNRLVTVNTNNKTIKYANYLGNLGQMSKYLEAGAVRVYSSETSNGITNVTYINPTGASSDTEEYVIIFNNTGSEKTVNVSVGGKTANVKVPSGFTTYTWQMPKADADDNHAPEFRELTQMIVDQFEAMSFQLEAVDQDDNALTYYAVDVPTGVEVNSTTGKVTWTPGVAGEYTLKFAVTDGIQNDQIEVHITVEGAPIPLPNKIDERVPNIKNGDSSSYMINAKEAGTYMLLINYSTNNNWSIENEAITVYVDGQPVDNKMLAVTWNGSGAIKLPITLSEGIHDLKLVYSGTGYGINYLDITKEITHRIPVKVEAEDYSNSYGINFEVKGNGYNISETNPNDWFEYKIKSPVDAEFEIIASYGNEADAVLDIYIDGVKSETTLSLPRTGAWGTYRNSPEAVIELEKGEHTIRFVIASETGANIDYFNFSTDAPIPVDKTELEETIELAESINLDNYISTNKDIFVDALEQAKVICDKVDATEQEVEDALKSLATAMAGLIGVADKTELNSLLTEVLAINLALYKEESTRSLNDAIEAARAIIANNDATQQEVENAISLLETARSELVLKEPTIEEGPKDEDKDENIVVTSDNTNIMLYIVFVGISLLGLIISSKRRRINE